MRPTLPAALLLAALCLPPLHAAAQEPLTLQDALARASAQNPELKAAESRIKAASARETQAAAWPNPNLTLGLDEAPFAAPLSGSLSAGISQPLLFGGPRAARIDAAKLDHELAELDRNVLRLDLATRVKQAYARMLYAQESLRNAQLGAEASETLLEAIRKRFEAGQVARGEVLRAEVERDRAKRVLSGAEGKLRQERGRLNVLMGRTAQGAIAIQTLPIPSDADLPPLASLVTRSLESRAELHQAELAIRREAVLRRVAQSGMWTGTEVSVVASTYGGQPGFSTALTVPIPFYRQQGEVQEAEANRQRAEAEREALRHRITLEVEEAYQEAVSAAKEAELFRKSYLPQAERLSNNAQRRFTAGESSGLEVIEARNALRETRGEYHEAVLAYRLAVARLERVSGLEFPQ